MGRTPFQSLSVGDRRDALEVAELLSGRRAYLLEKDLLIVDDLGTRRLHPTAAEELLEIVMRRYERTSTLLTSNRPVD